MSIQIVSKRLTRCLAMLALACPLQGVAQEPVLAASPTATPSPYSTQTLGELKKLQEAALASDYAYRQVAHLSNNIGPRLTGSAQAQKAVEYVAAELKAIGLEVQLEKVTVPHWVRGEETAALVEFPGMAEKTTQKIILTALGASVATPPTGLTAEVIVVRNFDELQSLGREKVAGKIVLFDYQYQQTHGRAGPGRRSLRTSGEVSLRWTQRRSEARRRRGAHSLGRQCRISATAHRSNRLREGRPQDSGRGGDGRGC